MKKTYKVSGICKDSDWLFKNRTTLESYLFDEIRNEGLVPVLDSEVKLLRFDYDADSEIFSYILEADVWEAGDAGPWIGAVLQEGFLLAEDRVQLIV